MGKFSKGMLFGAVVGAASGLLFAPRSGKATRQKFVDELEDWSDLKEDFTEKLDQFKESAQAFQAAADMYIEPFIDGVNQDVENFMFQAEPRLDQIQEQVEKIQEELPEATSKD
ncbi:YtxH domain-containing protein [Enterococcus plantarum]|uniref:YtxH domain-containing protein n=1 Tax=Enterococcus TaxID=1350 RepID=UPI0009F601E9|nr:YtxH domain-containing protein [Enterococcus plantarum]MBO0421293.1 YtxH domain-containing protein [Enterococcus plantarum]